MTATMIESKVEHALRLAQKGFRVFRLQPNSKRPLRGRSWKQDATSVHEVIEQFWRETPDANIGIATGGGLVVLDIDDKNDKKGSETLDLYDMLGWSIEPSLTVETPTGGRHIYLMMESGDLRNSAGKIGHGLDIRGAGGFVVAPGSTIDGKPYRVTSAQPIAPVPQWLIEKAERYNPRERIAEPATDLDTPDNISRAKAYLTDAAPIALEGDGGDETTFRVAAAVRDQGVSEDMCLELMLDHWNDHCAPPWDPEHLAVKVENAYRYARGAPGNAAPEAAFEPVEIAEVFAPVAQAMRPKLHFIQFGQAQVRRDRSDLIHGFLGMGAMSVMYGPSNVGKTFAAVDIAFHIATGRAWAGKRVEKAAVVYVAAEAGQSAVNRLVALRERYGEPDAPLFLVPCPVDLFADNGDLAGLIDLVAEAAEVAGIPVGLIVIDTLSRAMAGGNENASEDMGRFVRNIDRLRAGSSAHTLVVHHSGKDQARGARGHSLLRAATDTEIEISEGQIRVTKQRDMEACAPIGFALRTVDLGVNSYGEAITSCIVTKQGDADFAFSDAGPKLSEREVDALRALDMALSDVKAFEREGRKWVGTGLWAAHLNALKTRPDISDGDTDLPSLLVEKVVWGQRAFHQIRTLLQQKGLVVDYKRNQWSRP